jgi:uncharacterized protein with von Willebrand factor type A (vWA) domain
MYRERRWVSSAEAKSAAAEAQRRSFAYGNTHIGNPRITREMVDAQAEAMRDEAAPNPSNRQSQGGEVSMEQKNAQVVQQLQSLKNRLSSDKDAQTQLDQIIQQLQQEDQGSQERKSSR